MRQAKYDATLVVVEHSAHTEGRASECARPSAPPGMSSSTCPALELRTFMRGGSASPAWRCDATVEIGCSRTEGAAPLSPTPSTAPPAVELQRSAQPAVLPSCPHTGSEKLVRYDNLAPCICTQPSQSTSTWSSNWRVHGAARLHPAVALPRSDRCTAPARVPLHRWRQPA